jgi:hypothetical protein
MESTRRSPRPASERPRLTAIPTHVVLTPADGELAAAWLRLVQHLRRRKLGDGDPVQRHRGEEWRYLCSVPHRRDDGTIAYLHVFGHGCHPSTAAPMTAAVLASEGWWPTHQHILDPGRTWRAGRLRVVS